jgi:hypothetical protein
MLLRRLKAEAANLKVRVDKCTFKVSKCGETFMEHFTLYQGPMP